VVDAAHVDNYSRCLPQTGMHLAFAFEQRFRSVGLWVKLVAMSCRGRENLNQSINQSIISLEQPYYSGC
jgi:hypothetical protein